MDTVLSLKILLGLLAALLLVLTGVLGALFWQRWRAAGWPAWADQATLLRLGPPLLLALAVAAPIVAWWLLHLQAVPFGETWVLAGASLYLLAGIAWWLLATRLWALGGGAVHSPRFLPIGFGLALAALVLLVGILGLAATQP